MKRLIKWLLGLVLLAVVLLVIFLLSLDTILRVIIQHNIRSQTGMTAEIGKFHLGLTEPVVEIKDLQLYNPPAFGGTPFLNIPEIHVEYDRNALARNEIHITLLRFNLGELDVVKSKDGQTNLLSFGLQVPNKEAAAKNSSASLAEFKKRTNMDFKGIDCLNFSVGKFKYLDLQNQSNNLEQKIGIENCVVTNVTSAADLVGIGVVVGLRSGDFFKPIVAPDSSGGG
ncbi:MAG TPA: AsmA family protein, partial [Verrucomicrobiae bacterium]